MKNLLYLVVGVAVLAVLSGQSGSGANAAQWEYAVYEVVRTPRDRMFVYEYAWHEGDKTVRGDGEKFRLFKRLGAQDTHVDYHDLVLWNHLGSQGWEYVEQFQQTVGDGILQTQTIFRRRVR